METWRSTLAKNRKYLMLLLIVCGQIIFSVGGGIVASGIYYHRSNTVLPGVEVSGICLQGLTYEEAIKKLEDNLTIPPTLTLVWQEEKFEVPLDPSVSSYLLDELLARAVDLGKFADDRSFLFNLISWSPQRQSLAPQLTASPAYLWHELNEIKKSIDREPRDASITLEAGAPSLLPEKKGLSLDLAASRMVIFEYLEKGETEGIPLQVAHVEPDVSREHLPDFSQLLAQAGTSLEDNEPERLHNIALATEMLNELYLEAGEAFSFNETLGRATEEKGFLEVAVIVNREFVPGVGGGICQVSTTIYQAALKAELDIVQRSPHSRPVNYVPLGQDAAISYNLLDLKIRNNRDFPLLLVGEVNEEELNDEFLQFSIYGAVDERPGKIELSSEVTEIIPPTLLEHPDPNLPIGTRQLVREGQEGYRVDVYKVQFDNGQKLFKELLYTDYYMPVHEIVRVGKKQLPGSK